MPRPIAVAIEAKPTPPHGSPTTGGNAAIPHIVAAGRGALAEEILALAFAAGVRVRQDAGLAEMLVQMEMESPIPTEAIVTVAEILTKVYEANQRYPLSDGTGTLHHMPDP